MRACVYLEAAGDEGLGAVVVKTRESAEIRTRNIDARSADLEIKDLSKKKKLAIMSYCINY